MTRHRTDKYANFVEHPRYGRSPNITGLNPHTDYGGDTFIHWHSPKECRIPNSAIPADTTRQVSRTVPVTHYYDVKRNCRDCRRFFIFFAAEQKYWYETLGFGLESDCVRCVECRKNQQGIASQRARYEELSHVAERTIDETIEMAECCLSLIEASVFGGKSTHRVRTLLNFVPPESKFRRFARFNNLTARVQLAEG